MLWDPSLVFFTERERERERYFAEEESGGRERGGLKCIVFFWKHCVWKTQVWAFVVRRSVVARTSVEISRGMIDCCW
jgi:hypothetical protein